MLSFKRRMEMNARDKLTTPSRLILQNTVSPNNVNVRMFLEQNAPYCYQAHLFALFDMILTATPYAMHDSTVCTSSSDVVRISVRIDFGRMTKQEGWSSYKNNTNERGDYDRVTIGLLWAYVVELI